MSPRVGDRPHDLGQGLLEIGEVVVLDGPVGEGEVNLVEVETAPLLHAHRGALLREQEPVVSTALEVHVSRDLARSPVRKGPLLPLGGVAEETAPHLDDVDPELVQDRGLHHRELLDDVVDVDVARGDAEVLLQTGVGDGHDPRGAVAAEVDGDTVHRAVLDRGADALTGVHGCLLDTVQGCSCRLM